MVFSSILKFAWLCLLVSAQQANCSTEGSGILDTVCLMQKQTAGILKTPGKLGALQMDSSVATAFEAFTQTHSRTYQHGSPEFLKRQRIFASALAAVQAQNAKPNRLWTAGINQFSDRTQEEMKAFKGWRPRPLGGSLPSSMGLLQRGRKRGYDHRAPLPDQHSWNLWATSPEKVRNQNCANCWAAAGSNMLEAHAEIWQGVNRTFSMNELTHCTPNPFKCGGDGGCSGATLELAMGHVMLNGLGEDEHNKDCPANKVSPVDPTEPAPHEASPGEREAKPDAPSRKFGMVGWERLPQNKYEPILRALVTDGPVAVAVASSWSNYASGVYDGCHKGGTLDHAMLLIGYGADESKDHTKYWLLQNSWGKNWGENGHLKLLRTDNEESYCGDDNYPLEGTTCDDGALTPKSIKICGMCGILYDTVVPIFVKPSAQR